MQQDLTKATVIIMTSCGKKKKEAKKGVLTLKKPTAQFHRRQIFYYQRSYIKVRNCKRVINIYKNTSIYPKLNMNTLLVKCQYIIL